MIDEYLVKVNDKYQCYCGLGYVNHVYADKTWFSSGCRKRAKVFTKAEALELFGNKQKHFKIVKK